MMSRAVSYSHLMAYARLACHAIRHQHAYISAFVIWPPVAAASFLPNFILDTNSGLYSHGVHPTQRTQRTQRNERS